MLQAVEWCKGFLLRLQPEVFIITRLDVHHQRPGEGSEPLERFTSAVRRLSAFRHKSRRPGQVRVVHVNSTESDQDSSSPFGGMDLARWESRSLARNLRKAGAATIEWDPHREDFIAVLVRHMDTYR